MNPKDKALSKTMSFILRHNPAAFNLKLDAEGWCNIEELLTAVNKKTHSSYDKEDLLRVVRENDKQRFRISDDGQSVRASQGHSIEIQHFLEERKPPEFLFHGTTGKNMSSIRDKGLLKMNRHHVHLSVDRETAQNVGSRHGKPVVLSVRSGAMHRSGHRFFISENGVWLTESIAPGFIDFPN